MKRFSIGLKLATQLSPTVYSISAVSLMFFVLEVYTPVISIPCWQWGQIIIPIFCGVPTVFDSCCDVNLFGAMKSCHKGTSRATAIFSAVSTSIFPATCRLNACLVTPSVSANVESCIFFSANISFIRSGTRSYTSFFVSFSTITLFIVLYSGYKGNDFYSHLCVFYLLLRK